MILFNMILFVYAIKTPTAVAEEINIGRMAGIAHENET